MAFSSCTKPPNRLVQPGNERKAGPSTSVRWRLVLVIPLLAVTLLGSGCSVRRFAVNKIGDALASGGSTYAEDEDLELVEAALPFGLKLIEGLLAESPKHKGLLVTACEGFTTYSYVYVHDQAGRAAEEDLESARQIRERARRYGIRRLEASHPGISELLAEDPVAALRKMKKKDVPALYWNIFLANLELGYLTPPMGENLFLASYRFDRPIGAVFRAIVPYWLLLMGGVLVITYFPPMTLAVLELLGRT